MRLQRFTNYLLQHRLIALVLTFAVTFVPVVGIFGIIVAAFMTLTKGIIEGALFTLVATLPYFISLAFPGHAGDTTPLVMWAAISVAVISNLLTWVFAVMLRRQSTWSQIIQVAALMGLLVVSVVHIAIPNVDEWWGRELRTYYMKGEAVTKALQTPAPAAATPAVGEVAAAAAAPVAKDIVTDKVVAAKDSIADTNSDKPAVSAEPSDTTRIDAINQTKQYATGLMIAAILFNALMQLIVARWWQSALYYPRGLRRELHGIRLSFLASVLFVAGLVLAYMGNVVVIDMMPIVYLLFTAAGLSLIHWLLGVNKTKSTWFWIMILYVGLFISMPSGLVIISSLAAVDVWLNVRKRFRKF